MNKIELDQEILQNFGNKLRIRVSGILIKDDALVLVKHHNLGEKDELWAPPGGGMNFGENIHQTLIREFKEETGIDVEIGELLNVTEFLEHPLHAVELFFWVSWVNGELTTGTDPELDEKKQIISVVELVPFDVLKKMDNAVLHKILHNVENERSLNRLSGKYLPHLKS